MTTLLFVTEWPEMLIRGATGLALLIVLSTGTKNIREQPRVQQEDVCE
jgi:hypothetical protein